MSILEKFAQLLNQILVWIAGIMLGAMILLACANIFLRIVWIPVSGTFELVGYFGAIVSAFALGYTQIKKGHIAVDILVGGFSKKMQRILQAFSDFICMLLFGLATWQIIRYGTTLLKTGEVTETLRIIYYPFTYAVALGCATICLVFLIGFLKSALRKKEDMR